MDQLRSQVVSNAEAQQKPQTIAALRQARWQGGARGMLGSGQQAGTEAGITSGANSQLAQVAANQAMKGADITEQRRLEDQNAQWQRTQMEKQYANQLEMRMKARQAAEGLQKMQSENAIWGSLLGAGGNIAGNLIGSKLGGGGGNAAGGGGGVQNAQMPQSGALSQNYQPMQMASDPYAYSLQR